VCLNRDSQEIIGYQINRRTNFEGLRGGLHRDVEQEERKRTEDAKSVGNRSDTKLERNGEDCFADFLKGEPFCGRWIATWDEIKCWGMM
jgi:hypothetical protein